MEEVTNVNIIKAHYLGELSATDYIVNYINILEILNKNLQEKPLNDYITFYNDREKVITLNYEEFINKVYRLSNYLLSNGISKGDRIATISHNHYETVILYFSCWAIGAVVVPLNAAEESGRVKYIIENSSSKIIFTRKEYSDKLYSADLSENLMIVNFDEFSCDKFQCELNLNYHVGKEDECLIVYTSGTTGNPKGVVLTQYNLMADAFAISNWHDLHNDDVMMCVLPIHHVNGTVVTIMTTMFYGGKMILNQKFQTENFLKRIQDEKVKVVSVVPTLLQFLLHSDEESKNYDLHHLSHIICGAGPLTCELAKKFEDRFGMRIAHGYGLSETTCYSCFVPVDLKKEDHIRWQNQYGFPSIGIPIECNEMEIHNDKGETLEENVKGEIVIRGHNVMKYYFDNDEVNKKTFEFGWFRSGDEGFFKFDENGKKYFFITGRIKELIIRGAVNISPLEIDEVISMCSCVKTGIAVGFENDWYGEEVGALVMLKDEYAGQDKDKLKEEIISYCRKNLPFFKSPKTVVFSDTIPVTSTGKYQRNKVKYQFSQWKTIQFKAD
ncbi:MAG TPA: class I adenylate-forming enzyme family protein [Ignavibacteria bacterium]|nr:class I adenylate-forming enzyme family protein [Ignavibacteria bacterium]